MMNHGPPWVCQQGLVCVGFGLYVVQDLAEQGVYNNVTDLIACTDRCK
jgi:hypothetical protein